MRMYTVDEQIRDGSKVGVFYINLRLIKGYRYRFRYIWRDAEQVDWSEGANVGPMNDGAAANYIEVEADGQQSLMDFMNQNSEAGNVREINEVDLIKTKSYQAGKEDIE